jgi:hypothetical protein
MDRSENSRHKTDEGIPDGREKRSGCGRILGIAGDFTEKWLSKLGYVVGKHPAYFLVIPPLCCAIFLTSFQSLKGAENVLETFLPTDRRTKVKIHSC